MVTAVNKVPTYYMSRTDMQISNMFNFCGFKREQEIYDADLVVFGGGADINPFLYGEHRHSTTFVDYACDMTDIKSLRNCGAYQSKVGICRGGQFLNVVAGNGTLFQNVENHAMAGLHPVKKLITDVKMYDKLPETLDVTSTHHQMMRPGDDGDVIYGANISMFKETASNVIKYEADKRALKWDDVEVVYYANSATLCWQPHPEYRCKGNYRHTEAFIQAVSQLLLPSQMHEDVYCKFYENFSAMKNI